VKLQALPAAPYRIAREVLRRAPDPRVPEPTMLMEDPEAVEQFHASGPVNQVPLYQLCSRSTSMLAPAGATVLDLGSGSGRYLAHLARRRPDLKIVGLDLSEPMLATGRRMLAEEGLADRVRLEQGDITEFAASAPEDVAVVSCIQALHHLPTDDLIRRCLGQIAALRERTGCAVWIFDIGRAKHPMSYRGFISTTSPMPPVLEREAVQSERAALTVDELTAELERSGLGDLNHTHMRVLRVFQAHWAPHRDLPAGHENWEDVPLPDGTGMNTRMFLTMFPRLPRPNGRAPAGSRSPA
jgi:SAM-dependent methyltransferase